MTGAWRAPLSGGRWHFQHGPIDLVLFAEGADADVAGAYEAAWWRFATILDELVRELPLLRTPVSKETRRPEGLVARRMWRAVLPFAAEVFVTPMAAVAGAVAEAVLEAMTAAAPLRRAYVNNGGDIALHLAGGARFRTMIADHRGRELGAIEIDGAGFTGAGPVAANPAWGRSPASPPCSFDAAWPSPQTPQDAAPSNWIPAFAGMSGIEGCGRDRPRSAGMNGAGVSGAEEHCRGGEPAPHAVRGIATSGRHGRSHSLGIADSVTVLAASAPVADAAATLIANAVDLPNHPAIERTPASALAPDSDLGERLVVTGCGALSDAERRRALDAGVRTAEVLIGRGLVAAAFLHLAGETRLVQAPLPAARPAVGNDAAAPERRATRSTALEEVAA